MKSVQTPELKGQDLSTPTLPLMRAVAEGDAPALKALLARGTDVNCRNQSGQTPLMMAALLGHSALVPILLEFGADVSLRDNHGLSALDWSQRRGFTEISESLIYAMPVEKFPPDKTLNADGDIRARSTNELGPAATAMLKAAHAKREADASRQRNASEPSDVSESRDTASLEEVQNSARDTAGLEEIKQPIAQRDTAGLSEFKDSPPPGVVDEVKPPSLPVVSEESTPSAQLSQAVAQGVIEQKVQPNYPHESANARATNVEPPQILEPATEPAANRLDQAVDLNSEPKVASPPQSLTQVPADPAAQSPASVDLYKTQPIQRATAAGTGDSFSPVNTQPIPPGAVDTMLSSPARATAARLAPKQTAPFETEPAAEPGDSISEPVSVAPVPSSMPLEKAVEPGQATIKLSSSNRFIAAEGSQKARSQSLFTRPVIWFLATLLVGSAFVTYLILNRLAKSDHAAQVASTTVGASPTAPAPPVRPAPFVAGALSGAQLNLPDADYPAKAQSEGIKGVVTVLVRVNGAAGSVVAAQALNGDRLLRTSAEKAAKAAKFSPEKLPKESKVISGTISYTFGVADTQPPTKTDSSSPILGGALLGAEKNVPAADYPEGAKAKSVAGSVMVLVRVNRFGDVIAARALNGDTELRNAAVRAARKAKFASDKLPRETLVTSGTITYNFSAPQAEPTAKTASPAATTSSTAPAPATAKDNNAPVVGGELAGKELNVPNADYPAEARRKGITGSVEMLVRVNKQGRVISWRTLKGDPLLRPAALKAAKKATFSPQKLGNINT
ncbi:MAG TPA: TonB family protein, partial [Pyrinomonadaceae bacterium]